MIFTGTEDARVAVLGCWACSLAQESGLDGREAHNPLVGELDYIWMARERRLRDLYACWGQHCDNEWKHVIDLCFLP